MDGTETESAVQAGRVESGKTAERLLPIGQLVRELQTEFPDVSISKVRYLDHTGADKGEVSQVLQSRFAYFAKRACDAARRVLAS
jgi:hypothetical protein